jgi:hypothetical protein
MIYIYTYAHAQNYRINFICFLCECESWSQTLMEEYVQSVLENKMLRKTFISGRNEATQDW